MKAFVPVALFAPLLFALGCASQTETQAVTDRMKEVSATVEAVYVPSRLVALRTEDGRSISVLAGPEVRNLDQIRPGDRVTVSYYEGVAAQMAPPGEGPRDMEESVATVRAPEGEKPAGGIGRTVTGIVTIESVDPVFHTVSFRRADGGLRVVAVEDPEMLAFASRLKPGDRVELIYTEALAVAVEPGAPVRR